MVRVRVAGLLGKEPARRCQRLGFVADGSAIFRAISVKRCHSSLNGTAVRTQLSSRPDSTAVEEAFVMDSLRLFLLFCLNSSH